MRLNHSTFGLVLLLLVSVCQASVVVNSTRFIYRSIDREVSVVLSNEGEQPALVQVWIDRGDPRAEPSAEDVPFLISPSLLRLEPKKNQTLRLIFTGEKLPTNKESLFWLNVLEVPPKPSAGANENYLQFSIRSRLKLFYRPAGIGEDLVEAAKELSVSPIEGSAHAYRLVNRTPFHISLGNIQLLNKDGPISKPLFGMVNPFDQMDLQFEANDSKSKTKADPERMDFFVIDDLGATNSQSLLINSQRKDQ